VHARHRPDHVRGDGMHGVERVRLRIGLRHGRKPDADVHGPRVRRRDVRGHHADRGRRHGVRPVDRRVDLRSGGVRSVERLQLRHRLRFGGSPLPHVHAPRLLGRALLGRHPGGNRHGGLHPHAGRDRVHGVPRGGSGPHLCPPPLRADRHTPVAVSGF